MKDKNEQIETKIEIVTNTVEELKAAALRLQAKLDAIIIK